MSPASKSCLQKRIEPFAVNMDGVAHGIEGQAYFLPVLLSEATSLMRLAGKEMNFGKGDHIYEVVFSLNPVQLVSQDLRR